MPLRALVKTDRNKASPVISNEFFFSVFNKQMSRLFSFFFIA
jgi:hypothetical protein